MPAKPVILLIEDNTDIRECASELLELEGYEVYTAADGAQGVSLSRLINPDLVICDVVMPIMGGYEVFNQLKQDPKYKTTPFVFSTAQSERGDIQKASNLGVSDYLIKPFDDQTLLACIRRHLEVV
ncbi:response regulator [Mucilaginibacter mali]|jgi:CheY-like chemotaxis protein|uniref:Response regulator n=1 Tax=Mucilaginibacter mali TaxID=2740462 RepID=A0A7D4UPE3_9SPHI|nr:response regulator [Mucilaginibacter mali]QKJ33021.1 response regulator [Mucilaginibacter mali]